ncbi:MAG: HrpE/YscL family type III secretion apparatus protein [Verrucomicrobia bacterium]|nr:HrpE/YscL family type III secretion apparatus protein [Verrucomicrobiota bacterium]
MSDKKYFSMIYGSTIKQAPNSKVVPADSIAKILSAQEVLEAIKADAERYRKEVIAECETLKVQAEQEGFAEGYKQWTAQLAKMEEEIAKIREEMQKMVIPIALKAAKRIVSSELALSPQAILDIVASALKSVAQHKRIVIYVSRQDLETLEHGKGKIKDIFESLESLSIRDRDDIEQGGCIIETEGGIINARLQDRWRNLEAAFESLSETIRKGA